MIYIYNGTMHIYRRFKAQFQQEIEIVLSKNEAIPFR